MLLAPYVALLVLALSRGESLPRAETLREVARATRAGSQGGSKPVPAPADIARVERELDDAFAGSDPKALAQALESARALPCAAIVRALARGLAHESREVRLAVIQTLGRVEHADALELLHRSALEKRAPKDPAQLAAILRAIGQHADPRSIPILARDPFEPDDQACKRARLFGLAQVRTLEALEAVIEMLAVTVPGPASSARRIQGQMDDARIALVLLTGTDQGMEPERWEEWWRRSKKAFRIPTEVPPLPKGMRLTWDAYWGNPQVYAREPRREDRGR